LDHAQPLAAVERRRDRAPIPHRPEEVRNVLVPASKAAIRSPAGYVCLLQRTLSDLVLILRPQQAATCTCSCYTGPSSSWPFPYAGTFYPSTCSSCRGSDCVSQFPSQCTPSCSPGCGGTYAACSSTGTVFMLARADFCCVSWSFVFVVSFASRQRRLDRFWPMLGHLRRWNANAFLHQSRTLGRRLSMLGFGHADVQHANLRSRRRMGKPADLPLPRLGRP
jgi:hypothetical protein